MFDPPKWAAPFLAAIFHHLSHASGVRQYVFCPSPVRLGDAFPQISPFAACLKSVNFDAIITPVIP